nr:hypothetical protein [Candidatus Sigynarchaeota archaeon]
GKAKPPAFVKAGSQVTPANEMIEATVPNASNKPKAASRKQSTSSSKPPVPATSSQTTANLPRQGKAKPPVIVKAGTTDGANTTTPVPAPSRQPPVPPVPRTPSQGPPVPPVPKQETKAGVSSSSKISTAGTSSSSQVAKHGDQEGPRLQDLPGSEQRDIINKKITKPVRKLLGLRRNDFLKMNAKKLEGILDTLEIEKSRFTVYNPTDKMVRRFIDESIAIIHGVREEQLNVVEHKWTNVILPELIKKYKPKIDKILSKLDRYYTEMDAARDVVDLLKMKKSPFPSSYWVTLINQKIREHTLF